MNKGKNKQQETKVISILKSRMDQNMGDGTETRLRQVEKEGKLEELRLGREKGAQS